MELLNGEYKKRNQSDYFTVSMFMDGEQHEESYTIALLGENHDLTKILGEAFGKPGTKSDLFFFNRLDRQNNCVFTAVAPIGYPDKIKSLIQAAMLSQIHIITIDADRGITPAIGEILVLVDYFTKYYNRKCLVFIGNITKKNEWKLPDIEKKVRAFISQLKIPDVEILTGRTKEDVSDLKAKVIEIARKQDYPPAPYGKVLIDHFFPVKGIGTVILGLVQGKIEAGKMYDLIPVKDQVKRVVLRSIQKQDRDFKEAFPGDRVGLALKGVKPEEITRNTIFCEINKMKMGDKFNIQIEVCPFYKPINGKISPNDSTAYHLISNLGISAIKLEEGGEIGPGEKGAFKISLDKPLPYDDIEGFRGFITYFEPFSDRLRIVGYFRSND